MSLQAKPQRIVRTGDPIKEIWSMLNYFESEHNVRQFLNRNETGHKDVPPNTIEEIAESLSSTTKAAREYYQAAEGVTILTRPLLLFYGMTALSKVLFMAIHRKKSPSSSHGLERVKGWNGVFPELSVRVGKNGTFPQFHGCYSKGSLYGAEFSLKELLSLVPETKVAFETVYDEKSRAVKVERSLRATYIIDSDIHKYKDMKTLLCQIPGFKERYGDQYAETGDRFALYCWNHGIEDPVTRAVSGEEYFVLPLTKQARIYALPEMSTHFLIMYLLGMLARYQPKEWGEIIKGEKSGELYIIQNFLETTRRKFPNLILNELWHRDFFFVSPRVETQKELDEEQMDAIYRYVSRKMMEELGTSS